MLFSSEQVTAGHPDKICAHISDTILSDCLNHDHQSHVAIETHIKNNYVTVAGEEITTDEINSLCERMYQHTLDLCKNDEQLRSQKK